MTVVVSSPAGTYVALFDASGNQVYTETLNCHAPCTAPVPTVPGDLPSEGARWIGRRLVGPGLASLRRDRPAGALAFRALIDLDAQTFEWDGHRSPLLPGMQVAAEINLGTRTVLEYLLSPLRKAFHEAGRER